MILEIESISGPCNVDCMSSPAKTLMVSQIRRCRFLYRLRKGEGRKVHVFIIFAIFGVSQCMWEDVCTFKCNANVFPIFGIIVR